MDAIALLRYRAPALPGAADRWNRAEALSLLVGLTGLGILLISLPSLLAGSQTYASSIPPPPLSPGGLPACTTEASRIYLPAVPARPETPFGSGPPAAQTPAAPAPAAVQPLLNRSMLREWMTKAGHLLRERAAREPAPYLDTAADTLSAVSALLGSAPEEAPLLGNATRALFRVPGPEPT